MERRALHFVPKTGVTFILSGYHVSCQDPASDPAACGAQHNTESTAALSIYMVENSLCIPRRAVRSSVVKDCCLRDVPFRVRQFEPELNNFESTSMQACEADWNLNNIPALRVSSPHGYLYLTLPQYFCGRHTQQKGW